MRKKTVRNGLLLIIISLAVILGISFFHNGISSLFSLTTADESRLYRLGIFWGTAIGGYGVVLSVFGCILANRKQDVPVRLLPWFMTIIAMVSLFFYLLSSSFDTPVHPDKERLHPGETMTI